MQKRGSRSAHWGTSTFSITLGHQSDEEYQQWVLKRNARKEGDFFVCVNSDKALSAEIAR